MTLRLRDDVSMVRTDTALVVLDERNGRYWQLNPTAADILDDLLAGCGDALAAERLARRCGIGPERAREDVARLLATLVDSGVTAP
ncbi:lasso peptide biosynthesis PqqD family chaperone [Streptomyces sp. NPDC001985]|uniref:lasso peptide biosynthesis PqqD family chaperone n=1 Tax=Streptomyces sp. NPDC001985 TaxID=3154406 RepID=UPI00331D5959